MDVNYLNDISLNKMIDISKIRRYLPDYDVVCQLGQGALPSKDDCHYSEELDIKVHKFSLGATICKCGEERSPIKFEKSRFKFNQY